jgi:hypothetical protein
MAIVMDMVWDGVTQEQYDEARQRVNWEGNVPQGANLHLARFTPEGIRVTDVWASQEDFQNFAAERLIPVTSTLGITTEPQVTFSELHSLFAPNVAAAAR